MTTTKTRDLLSAEDRRPPILAEKDNIRRMRGAMKRCERCGEVTHYMMLAGPPIPVLFPRCTCSVSDTVMARRK